MAWSESRPYGDYYTLFELRRDGDVSHKALAEFWRGILTDGRRLAAGWNWRSLAFRVSATSSSRIEAWFTGETHHRLVPVLFAFLCPAIVREYDRLPQVDGDVTDEVYDQFHARYGQHLARAARINPVPRLLSDWRQERAIPVELELLDGWIPLEV